MDNRGGARSPMSDALRQIVFQPRTRTTMGTFNGSDHDIHNGKPSEECHSGD